jgi:tRNA pseudouridine55 synthase
MNGIFLLDKPIGISSNRALQIVKHLFRAKKAGHTGSLDPLRLFRRAMSPIFLLKQSIKHSMHFAAIFNKSHRCFPR